MTHRPLTLLLCAACASPTTPLAPPPVGIERSDVLHEVLPHASPRWADDPITFRANDSQIVAHGDLHAVALELQDLIARSTGETLPISTHPVPARQHLKLAIRPGLDVSKDGFVVHSPSPRDLVVLGATANAVAFGVYDLVEEHLGVRWLFPGELGTIIPEHDALVVPRDTHIEEPAYLNRRYSQGLVSADWGPWVAHMRVTGSQAAFHHNLYNLFPPTTYRASHPEFYPVRDGVRYPDLHTVGTGTVQENHSWQPVVDAPGITDIATANIRDYFDSHPTVNWYSLGMNDSTNFGDAQLMGQPLNALGYPHMSDVYLPWANSVAAAVQQTHHGRRFGLLAYHNLAEAPVDDLDPAIVPFMTYDRMQWIDPARAAADQQRTVDWQARGHELGWYDYVYGDQRIGGRPPTYLAPRLYPHTMADYLRFGRDHDVRHYYAEAYPSTDEWSEGPKLYILSKLLWNPDEDVDALLDDWVLHAVGPDAASTLRAYYDWWEDFWMHEAIHSPWFLNSRSDYLRFTDTSYVNELDLDDRLELDSIMADLAALTRGTAYEDRADFIIDGWSAVRSRIFGDRFDFEQGLVPAGFDSIHYDGMEGPEGVTPPDWLYWNRPNVGSTVQSHSYDHGFRYGGNSSFHLAMTPDGTREGYVILYRSFPVEQYREFCVRVQAFSPHEGYGTYLAFHNPSVGSSWLFPSDLQHAPTQGEWKIRANCNTIPDGETVEQVVIFLLLRGSEASQMSVWFDDVELFGR